MFQSLSTDAAKYESPLSKFVKSYKADVKNLHEKYPGMVKKSMQIITKDATEVWGNMTASQKQVCYVFESLFKIKITLQRYQLSSSLDVSNF